ncbi:hypothetical protein P13BB106kb_p019 [Pectobacterium phage DU_PP_V]|uniref:Uncharacterized protein n=1 Tax=Pectobacterium phage DU_PP_V TaxID=2041492 RepID=A0A2D2W706_9CAUD|nr:hypothetical protein HOS40_gp019 [Pectobacterium phage DU_PP_V]ATS94003.1 hypothetical protein P13BB106kb_p019 [Pectobacterium phage DU_PP_V]
MSALTEAIKILEENWDENAGQFHDLFIQLFVETNGTINHIFFNTFYDTTFSVKELLAATKAVSGSKVVQFTEPDKEGKEFIFDIFTKVYEFGKYVNPREYIYEVWEQTDTVLSRLDVLTWISKQRPEKSLTSFAPANDRNNYEQSTRQPLRKSIRSSEESSGDGLS